MEISLFDVLFEKHFTVINQILLWAKFYINRKTLKNILQFSGHSPTIIIMKIIVMNITEKIIIEK